MRVVIDTNILINGSTDDYNYGNRIVDAILDGTITAFANKATRNENKLLTRIKIKDQDYLDKLKDFFGKLKIVQTKHPIKIVRDPEDNKLLESAVAAHAEYLVTSDMDLLILGNYEHIKIVRPEEFWNIYEEAQGNRWQNWVDEFMK